MHVRARRQLQDALTAIRHSLPLAAAGCALLPNGERHLREPARLARLYPRALLEATLAVAARCRFSLDELRYEYPREIVPRGLDAERLAARAHRAGRAPALAGDGMPPTARAPRRARARADRRPRIRAVLPHRARHRRASRAARGILCQGRGSAANSAVCYCLGITAVDPARMSMLFERFISRERNEPPDIDIDFEHERREEVIQYIYGKYGRERAALAATVITYRPRSALRDLGKALGLDPVQAEKLAGAMQWWDSDGRRRRGCARPASSRTTRCCGGCSSSPRELLGFPRHLSQHVGGFVIAARPLEELVPVENAAMPERTVIQWDKDDLDDLGLLKVDVLGLGMLTAIRRALRPGVAWRSRARRAGHARDGRHPGRGSGGLRHDLAAPTRSACSRSSRARRWRCCRGCGRATTTTW